MEIIQVTELTNCPSCCRVFPKGTSMITYTGWDEITEPNYTTHRCLCCNYITTRFKHLFVQPDGSYRKPVLANTVIEEQVKGVHQLIPLFKSAEIKFNLKPKKRTNATQNS